MTTTKNIFAFSTLATVFALAGLGCSSADVSSADVGPEGEATGSGDDELLVATSGIWGATVPVCWNLQSPQRDAAKREIVRNAVAASWERVSKVRFTGWGDCPRTGAFGDRVSIDARPGGGVAGIGKNATNNWAAFDLNDPNLGAVAVHEFGHVLGFYHEQARGDTPATGPLACNRDDRGDLRSNPPGSLAIGNYDPDSVMNYCNDNWTNARLSATDMAGVRKYYGTRVDIVGGPGVSSSGRNSLDVFVRDSDNLIWQKALRNANGQWDSWSLLGGRPMASDPAVLSRPDGAVFVFARGVDNQLWQQTNVGSGWQGWYPHGGALTSGPAIATFGGDKLDIFARGEGNRLIQKTARNGTWSAWTSYPGEIAGDPAAVTWSDGSIFVFARSLRNTLVQKTFRAGAWSDWYDHGGTLTSNPTVTSWGVNSLFVFARGPGNLVQQKTLANGVWQGWWTMPGQMQSDPAVVTFGPGTMFVFATGFDNQLWQKSNTNNAWQDGWYPHP